tara:strand:- start:138 stop:467 length:330 start_codon:yes stop_codon:yes gene_type:complete
VDFVSFGNKKKFNDFKNQIPIIVQPLFEELRQFCLELGENIVEDVRMHRIVFCKSMTFRWFTDLEPTQNSILIKIQKSRKIPITSLEVFSYDKLEEIKTSIKDAYTSIH